MKSLSNKRYPGLYILYACAGLFFATSPLLALGKTGADPGAPAGGGDFVAGNAAVATDVNKQINLLYKAFNDGTNSINIDSWTNTTGSLGYTGGNLGVGIATPLAKFQVNGGSAITLAGATGFGVFGATAGNHVAIDSTQIQTKASETTVAHLSLNPLGGFVGVGTAPGVKFHVDGGSAVSTTSGSGYAAFGPATGQHIAIDANQIQSKGSGTTAANLSLNPLGGDVSTGGNVFANGGNVYVQSAGGLAGINIKGLGDGANSSQLRFSNYTATNAWGMFVRQNSPYKFAMSYYDGSAWTDQMQWDQSTGRIRLVNYGAGTLVTDASGNVTASSDARLKNVIGDTVTGLNELMQLKGRRWQWKSDSGMETKGVYEGFIAQEVQGIIPSAVGQDASGFYSLSYVALMPTLVNAIKEIKREKDVQVIALERRAEEAEKKSFVAVSLSNRDRTAADTRIAALEKNLAEQGRRLSDELMARKQQEIRLARLEQVLQQTKLARR